MEIFALEIVGLLAAAFVGGCLVGHVLSGLWANRLSPPIAAQDAMTAAAISAGAKNATRKAKRDRKRDDLTRIKGVGPTIAKKLQRMGIKSFEQIADWDLADVAVIDQRLSFKGRIEREDWIAQARKLAQKGG